MAAYVPVRTEVEENVVDLTLVTWDGVIREAGFGLVMDGFAVAMVVVAGAVLAGDPAAVAADVADLGCCGSGL